MDALDGIAHDWNRHHARMMARLDTMLATMQEACEGIPEPPRVVADWVERKFRDANLTF